MKKFLEFYLNTLYIMFFLLLTIGVLGIIILCNVCISEYKEIHTINTIIFFIKIFLFYLLIVIFYILSIKQLNKILKYTTDKKDCILAVVYNFIANLPFVWYLIYTILFYNHNIH